MPGNIHRHSSLVFVLLLIVQLFGFATNSMAAERTTVAILWPPNLSDDTNSQHWQSTVNWLLTQKFKVVRSIRVCPASSVAYAVEKLRLKKENPVRPADARKIGETIEAHYVVFGSYRQEGGKWTLSMQVMNAASGKLSEEHTVSVPAWMEIASEMARKLLQDMDVTPSEDELKKIEQNPTKSEQALEIWSQACADQRDQKSLAFCEKEFRQAIALDGEFAEAERVLAGNLILQNRLDEAFEAARLAVKIRPDLADEHAVMGEAYAYQGLNHLALEEYKESAHLDPDDPDNWTYLVSAHYQLHQLDEAKFCCEQAASLAPFGSVQHANLSFFYYSSGERAKALKEADLAAQYCYAGTVSEELGVAKAYAQLGDYPNAIACYETYLANTKETGTQLPDFKATENTLTALKAILIPHYVKAERPRDFKPAELEAAFKERLTPAEYKSIINPMSSTPEMEAWAKQLTEGAKTPEEKARKLFQELSEHVCIEPPNTDRTATEVFKAWKVKRNNFSCQEYALFYIALARSLGLDTYFVVVTKDAYSNAVSRACAGVFLDGKPLLVDATYHWFGVPHQGFQFYDDFKVVSFFLSQSSDPEVLKLAIKLMPDLASGHFRLGWIYATQNRLEEARLEMDRCLKLEPSGSHGILLQAYIDGQEEKWQDAVKDWETALKLNPNYNSGHYFWGTASLHLKNWTEARDEYRAYLEGETDPKTADYARSKIAEIDNWLQSTNNSVIKPLSAPLPLLKQ